MKARIAPVVLALAITVYPLLVALLVSLVLGPEPALRED